jgi:hypothetical protein
MSEEYWIIGFSLGVWYILDSRDMTKISGPYDTHEDVVEGIKTRWYRIRQG